MSVDIFLILFLILFRISYLVISIPTVIYRCNHFETSDKVTTMIYSRTFGIFLLFAVIFAAAAWAGYAAHGFWVGSRQLEQPGWCCTAKKSVCVVAENNDTCKTDGGSVFNWDQETCNAICSRTNTQKSKSAKTTPQR